MNETKFLDLLKERFETPEAVITELINLEAIQNLPKGTELYLSDIHGADQAFEHILRTGAGNVREKISNYFDGKWTTMEMNRFGLLISYPEFALKDPLFIPDKSTEWYVETIIDLINFMEFCAVKYTRSKLRKALPEEYVYIIEELLYTDLSQKEKDLYYHNILHRLISLGQAERFIVELCTVIQQLVIDHLHLVGDIFDRSSGESAIMEDLLAHHSVDIQWGNHDILWMGAMFGSKANLMTLLRIAARYGYLFALENTYGLNLRPLFLYAEENYEVNNAFRAKVSDQSNIFKEESETLLAKVHQALAIIQFKLEGQIIKRRPEFDMNNRLLLDKLNPSAQTVKIDGEEYKIKNFPYDMIDQENPFQLSSEEEHIVSTLLDSFQKSEKLNRYMDFMLEKGSMYLIYNDQLLYHGCIPLSDDEEFLSFTFEGKEAKGKGMLDQYDHYIRLAARDTSITDDYATDLLWYAWTGPVSPLFGRDKMTTFERYYVEDEETHKENRNAYFEVRKKQSVMEMILSEFELAADESKVINGHTPVEVKKGEEPVKANGRLIVIDGGMSEAYQKSTGIAGYSLLNNSFGFLIVTHQPFDSIENLFEKQQDDTSLKQVIDGKLNRKLIKDTTVGVSIQEQIDDLQKLLFYIQNESI